MNRTALLPLALLGALALPAPARSQASAEHAASPSGTLSARPSVRAARLEGAIRIDGRLDEAAWAAATPVTGFTQYDPDEGAPASEATEARILFDGEALYVGVRLHDRGQVRSRLGRRDMPLGDVDWVGLVIDSYHDHRTAYSFDLNPDGVHRDCYKTDAEGDDYSWDPVWEGDATLDPGGDGWSAEYRIPFSQLRFNPAAEHTWGIQVERVIGRRNEYSVFSFVPKRERGGIGAYGHLEGLSGVETGKRLEVLPYTVARAESVDPGANPFRGEDERSASFGVDVKYRVTSDLTLDATLNPDFGQVEVDPATVNLSAVETLFEEKRPFFVEGGEIFSFGAGVHSTGGDHFYSRRVGARASGLAPATDTADVPALARILGAAKLSGKTAGGWSVGVLEAVTGRREARFLTGGEEERMPVEPLSNYFVGRLRRELRGGQTWVGGIVTAVNRDLETEEMRRVLRSGAYTAGLDFRHEFAGRRWALTGFVSGSRVTGSTDAIARAQNTSTRYFGRPDATHLEVGTDATALSGAAGALSLRKQAGEHWSGNLSFATVAPGYETNDLGYQYRADRVDLSGGVVYRERRPGAFLRTWYVESTARIEHNYAGQQIYNSLYLGTYAQTLGYWTARVNGGVSFPALDDRLTRGGPLARRPGNGRVYAELSSDGRRAVTGTAGYYHLRDDEGGWQDEASLEVGLKTSPRWNLTLSPRLTRFHTRAQYVDQAADAAAVATFGRRYVFAPLEQTTVSLETRLNYTFNPALTLEIYAQPFLSSADFGESVSLRAPRTFDFGPYAGPLEGDDFNVRSLRGNAVLRWEWRPGSTLYLAWQQTREDVAGVGDFDLSRDRQALFRAQPDNVFLMKVSYWLNP